MDTRFLLLFVVLLCADPTIAEAQPFTMAAPDGVLDIDSILDVRQPAHQSPAVLSPDGEWLAWVETGAVRLQGSTERLLRHDAAGLATLRIVNTRTRSVRTVSAEEENAWAPAWSPDGSRLAFFSNRGEGARLRIFDPDSNTTRTPVQQRIWTAWLRNTPVWLPDATGIVCKFVPTSSTYSEMLRRMSDRAADHRMGSADGSVRVYDLRPETSENPAFPGWMAARYGGDLGVVRMNDPEIVTITQGSIPTWWGVSPDGMYLGFVEFADTDHLMSEFRLGFVDLESGATRRAEQVLRLSWGESVSWSPSGHRLAFVAAGTGDDAGLLIADASDASVRKLAEPRRGWTRNLSGPDWAPDGGSLWFVASGGVDVVDAASGSIRDAGIAPGIRIDEILTSHRIELPLAPAEQVPVVFDSTAGGGRHIGLLDHRTGEVRHVATPQGQTSFGFHSDVAADGRSVTFRISAAHTPPEYELLDLAEGSLSRLTDLNPGFDASALDAGRLVAWRTQEDDMRQGALYLPGGRVPDRPLPVIIEVYGGQSARSDLDDFSVLRSALVGRGYGVFVPDIPMDGTDPVRDHVQAVVPAVRMLIERGIADSTRIGLTGQSYGGYGTVALLARTDLFSAAVASAAQANLAGMFSRLTPDGIVYTQWAEFGQGRMRGTPWDVPERYVNNSVLFSMDDITTPLLLIHGAEDRNTPVYLAGEIFTSLRRLDRRVQLAVYEAEGHWPRAWSRDSQRDYWTRLFEWFEQNLDGGS